MIPIFEPEITEKEKQYVSDAVNSGWVSSQGEYILKFEEQFALRFGKKYGVSIGHPVSYRKSVTLCSKALCEASHSVSSLALII